MIIEILFTLFTIFIGVIFSIVILGILKEIWDTDKRGELDPPFWLAILFAFFVIIGLAGI